MRGAVIYAPGDVRVERRDDPEIINPADAVIRLSATCVCGSDLWAWRGINPVTEPHPMGHGECRVIASDSTPTSLAYPQTARDQPSGDLGQGMYWMRILWTVIL